MRCEAQDAPCGPATQADCNKTARPNPTGKIGELISCHILKANHGSHFVERSRPQA